jgi:hypothetical protein
VDRLVRWIERHQDVPFFAFVHLYDPHDPFEPRAPYDTMWAEGSGKEKHVAEQNRAREFI